MKLLTKILTSALLLVLVFPQAQSQTYKKSPKIGLVLSGGGARGFAHIGVIKVLEEEGIDVDYIGGTSMGSVVGGLYAMGYSIYEIEEMALTQDWDYVLNDKVNRQELGFYEKYDSEKYALSLALSGRKISIPPGLVYGQNVTQLLTELTNPAFQTRNFNDLDKPFFCMATDLLSGKAIKLDTGNLAVAIRASMSVPSAFAPVEYGPYYLVDGGVINNFPAEYVKNMGADYLIGVDIQTPLYRQEEINNLVQVLSQSIFLNGEAAFNRNVAMIDFLIKPTIDPFTAMDFGRADSLIRRGEEKARQLIPQLRKFLDSIGHQTEMVRGRSNTFPVMDMLYVDRVMYFGNKKLSNKYLNRQLDINAGDQISMKELNERITQLHGTNLFHTVQYELEYTKSGETIIKLFVEEAALFDVNVGAHYNDYSKAGLLLNLTSRNLGVRNGRLSIDLALSKVTRFAAEYVVDNGLSPGFGASLDLFNQYGYSYDEGKKVISYDIGVARTQGFGLMTFENIMRLKLGFELEQNSVSQDISIIDFDNFSNFSGSLFSEFIVDTYDRIYFPQRGLYLKGKFELGAGENVLISVDENENVIYDLVDFNFTAYEGRLEGVVNLNNNFSLVPSFYFRKVLGENVLFSKISSFGGFQKTYIESYLPFPGYDFMQIEGHTAIFPSINFRYNFWKNHYFCLKTNLLSIDLNLDKSIDNNDFYYGAVLSYSYYTPLGPITVSMANALPLNKYVFDIGLGFWF